jgi:XTP/dITP diphosphohydrolase
MRRLVIATGNAHKVEEYGMLLPGIPVGSLSEFPPMPDVDESAPDFIGNAILKARAAHFHTGEIVLSDDSGLSVSALDGRPGVRSARYVVGTDRDRYEALLVEMQQEKDRLAWFTCAIAIAGLPRPETMTPGVSWKDGCLVAEGRVNGAICRTPRGSNGFGYDPVFELSNGRTAAELSASEKHSISHRGNALREIRPILTNFFIDAVTTRR